MSIKISVAMATFNGEKYIRQQLSTIAAQTYLPHELVVCDDGSSDSTLRIVRDFSSTVSFPVHIFSNEANLGFANNFLRCASLCAGEWIAFCDQDDVWLPNKLDTIKKVIDGGSPKLVLVYHAAELVDESLELLGSKLPLIDEDQTTSIGGHSVSWFVGGCVMCFKSVLIREIDSSLRPRDNYQFNEGWRLDAYPWMPHDKWICMLANILGEIAAVAQVLSLYRRHGYAVTGLHNELSNLARIKKSIVTGHETYDFSSKIWMETATSLSKISSTANSAEIKSRLLIGAALFRKVSHLFGMRARLYSASKISSRFRLFYSLIRSQMYWGDRFSSLGLGSFLKDLVFTIGILRRQKAHEVKN